MKSEESKREIAQRTFPTHQGLIPGAFPAFPEATSGFTDQDGAADPTVLGAVDLFPGTEATVSYDKSVSRFLSCGHPESMVAYQIMRFACSLGWSVAASWHLWNRLVCVWDGGVGLRVVVILVARKDLGAAAESVGRRMLA